MSKNKRRIGRKNLRKVKYRYETFSPRPEGSGSVKNRSPVSETLEEYTADDEASLLNPKTSHQETAAPKEPHEKHEAAPSETEAEEANPLHMEGVKAAKKSAAFQKLQEQDGGGEGKGSVLTGEALEEALKTEESKIALPKNLPKKEEPSKEVVVSTDTWLWILMILLIIVVCLLLTRSFGS